MKKNKRTILSTKFLSKSAVSKALQHDIIIEEISFISTNLIDNEPLKIKLKGFLQQNITAVFTSKNAVLAFDQIANAEVHWQIFCIGQATKIQVSKIFGEEKITGTADTAAALSEIILQDNIIKKVIFFCGNHRRDELPKILTAGEIEVDEIMVYETLETPEKILPKFYDGILFFSPSAVNSFFQLNKIDKQTQVFTIGKTTAESLQQDFKKLPIVADLPLEETMIDKVIAHFNSNKQA